MAAPSRPQRPSSSGPDQPRQRETADERRDRRTAVAAETQVDLKREAAERRDRKNAPEDAEESA